MQIDKSQHYSILSSIKIFVLISKLSIDRNNIISNLIRHFILYINVPVRTFIRPQRVPGILFLEILLITIPNTR